MKKIDLKSLAKRQWQDYQQNNPGTFFSTEKNTLSLEEAYEVQKEYTKIRCTTGEETVGYKVGCTGSKIIKQFGIAGPIYGRLFKNEIYVSGIKLKKNNFKNLAVEAEMAVEIGKDLRIKKAFPVIELHNFIFRLVFHFKLIELTFIYDFSIIKTINFITVLQFIYPMGD